MELQDYIRILKKNWVLILVITLLTTALTAAWTLTRTPVYQAQSKLYVSVRTGDASVGDLQQGTNYARQAVASYVDIVTTSIVTDQVAAQLGGGLTSQQVASKLSASSPSNTVLINVAATDTDPAAAAEIANTTSSVFAEVVTEQLEKPSQGAPARVQIDVVEPAEVPSSPISPNASRNITLGLLLGLMLGFGVAVLRAVLDVRVNSKNDVAAVTDTPILGGIIRDPHASDHPLIVQEDPLGPRAEAFRQLRTNLQFLRVEGNPHSFVITSSGASEGKTTTAANLAIALSETQASVCLVDGDLRKPRIADLFGIEGGVGLTDVIIGRRNVGDVVQAWGPNRLDILPAGHRPPNPSELLGSREMESLLAGLTRAYDYVIVDSPPVLVVTDAALISQSVGGALMVVAEGKTKKPQLEAALEGLKTIDSRVLGIILAMVPEKGPDSYGFTTYSYGELHQQPSEIGNPVVRAPRGKWKTLGTDGAVPPAPGSAMPPATRSGGSTPILGS